MGRREKVFKTESANLPQTTTAPRRSSDRQYDSPPRTPPAQIGRAGKSRGGANVLRSRPSLHDAFGDELNQDLNGYARDRSNSHGLSWSPRNTRDSIVDNMLLSFDKFGLSSGSPRGTTPPLIDDAQFASVQQLGLSNGRPRGHTTSSSVSSDYSLHAESPSSGQTRHRSNSSSNFQTSLGRIDSIRLVGGVKSKDVGLKGITTAGHTDKVSSTSGSPRGKGKSSTPSSVDHGRGVAGGMSRQQLPPHGRRSASFDNGYRRTNLSDNLEATVAGQDSSYLYGDFDAAPNPTIPGGPRKDQPSPPSSYRPPSSLSASQGPSLRHRGSIRTPGTLFSRNERLDVPENHSNGEPQGLSKSSSQNTSSSAQTPITPIKSYTATVTAGRTPIPSSKERDRPGFFKRVFGSSTKATPTSSDTTISRRQANGRSGAPITNRSVSLPINDVSTRSTNTPSTDQTQPTTQKSSTKDKVSAKDNPPLNKKTSFFRRRRKSVQDTSPVPVPHHSAQSHPDQYSNAQDLMPPGGVPSDTHPDSPSSLRRVMDPYLENHKRLGSVNSVGTHDDAKPKRHIPASTAHSTIRTVTTSGSGQNQDTIVTSTTTTSIQPIELEAPPTTILRERPNLANRRFSSVEDKVAAAHASADRAENDRPHHNPSHARTQSDIDKDLPQLPVNYNTGTTIQTKSTAASKFKSISPRLSSKDATNHNASMLSDTKIAETVVQPPKRSSSRQLPRRENVIEQGPTQETSAKTSESTIDTYKSAGSKPVSPLPDAIQDTADLADETLEAIRYPTVDPTEPLPEHVALAEKLFAGTAGIERTETAPWLGEAGPERGKIRKAYMELFDWSDMSILGALRGFCSSVQLKGETQQVDRVLDAISSRWCDCNPNHGFKATDVVHTICYSVLLLNTDLHLADIESKMTRTQFIKNTMPTIRRVVADAAPNAFDNARASVLPPPKRPNLDQIGSGSRISTISSETQEPAEGARPTYRLSTRPSDHSGNDNTLNDEDCGPLVKTPFYGKLASWELQVEVVLKNFYNSIRQHRLPLSNGEEQRPAQEYHPSSSSLSAVTGGMLRRTNSLLSKAGSETLPARGRLMESRNGSRWSSKARSRPRLYAASLAQSRTSIDEDQSIVSPSMSSMWSRHSLGRTQTSMSANSFGSEYPIGEYQRSIGFANALSQAIIRDDPAAESTEDLIRVGPLLEDESLELEGAPWAKEGNLKHKHHLEAVDKRSKDRSWTECFTVIEKGWIRLFQFNMNARSLRQKARANKSTLGNSSLGGVVGGGNWMANAQSINQFLLRHTIASALPPPGYSKARPHVWALSLPTGAVHLFQAGTPEIVKEFVSTANYWSARLSKEPLVGGVSNVEYGWSERVINMALVGSISRDYSTPPAVPNPPVSAGNLGPGLTSSSTSTLGTAASGSNASRPPSAPLALPSATVPLPPPPPPPPPARPSFQASIRSSIDAGSSRQPKLPGDRVPIADWAPPTQSMMASQLLEVDQLRALDTYVKNIEEELRKHNELRGPMLLAFSTRSTNYGRAMGNWERKSAFLLREIVKFRTYLESLQGAKREVERVRGERERKDREKETEVEREREKEDELDRERERERERQAGAEEEKKEKAKIQATARTERRERGKEVEDEGGMTLLEFVQGEMRAGA